MERRSQARQAGPHQVVVTLLGPAPTTFSAQVTDISGRGLALLSRQRLWAGDAVQIELSENTLLGRCCYCHREGAQFRAGIEFHQALTSVRDLARLASAIAAQAADQELAERPTC
jgi:hypothetical protein